MEIKIKSNAAAIYAKGASDYQYNSNWFDILKSVEGKTLVVETEHLFKDQFNTAPISSSRVITV